MKVKKQSETFLCTCGADRQYYVSIQKQHSVALEVFTMIIKDSFIRKDLDDILQQFKRKTLMLSVYEKGDTETRCYIYSNKYPEEEDRLISNILEYEHKIRKERQACEEEEQEKQLLTELTEAELGCNSPIPDDLPEPRFCDESQFL